MTIIAIDGTFASGKGTLGKKLAKHYGYAYLDTGKLYRAVAHQALQDNAGLGDGASLGEIALNLDLGELDNPVLKSGPVGAAASKVAVHKQVRAALLSLQRDFANAPGPDYKGAVLDGRDIGTVICPNADVKLYVDAAPEVRAKRRYEELRSYGEDVSFEDVLAQLKERDARDMGRKDAPLKPAANAHLLDTTNLAIEPAFEAAKAIVDAVLSAK
ncbi:MAG TPA: (d)CMP kinase [Hellea balneolensis]|uniref:Cytidylate kinase n=1 Tax=Hellea balneolensis TaxID=287478 RepID=A0A7C5QSC7_9PROT|nr:(d)CMP kinase [Hellea balneolensis]